MNTLVKVMLLIAAIVLAGVAAYVVQQTAPPAENGETPDNHMSPLTAVPASINWTGVSLFTPVTRNSTITNNSEQTANLTVYTGNASANLYDYTLTWDAEGILLQPTESVTANFTLTVLNATVGDTFSFKIVVADKS